MARARSHPVTCPQLSATLPFVFRHQQEPPRPDAQPSDSVSQPQHHPPQGGRARVARLEAPTKPLGSPLILAPVAQAQQFQKRAQFSVWSILTNPFYMMMFFMAIMIFVVPRTMDAMDPEERKAMQARTLSEHFCCVWLANGRRACGR